MDHTDLDKMVSRILLLLTLTSSVCVSSAGTFELNQTQSFYEAVENQTITLEWTFTIRRPLRPLQDYKIYCDHYNGVRGATVYFMQMGVEISQSQHQDFTGRVQLDEDAFREGRLRVHVSRLQTEHSGLYRCQMSIGDEDFDGTCRLSVSAAANETQTLRPGPERPGPVERVMLDLGPETNLATCVTCLPFGIFILLSLLL